MGISLMILVLRMTAALVIAVTATLFVHWVWQRQLCNLEQAEIRSRIEQLTLNPESISSRIAARDLVARVTNCIAIEPVNVGLYMLRAALFRLLERPDDAVADYKRALRIDRRAELYLNIGDTELASGHLREALDAFILTAFTQWPYISEVPESQQATVVATVVPLREAIQQRKPMPALFHELHQRIVAGYNTPVGTNAGQPGR
jgi:tetratricopeptide (TPR) repeat protein